MKKNENIIHFDLPNFPGEKGPNFLSVFFDEFILATQDKNIKMFKWRNRIILILIIIFTFIFFFNKNIENLEEKYKENGGSQIENFIDKPSNYEEDNSENTIKIGEHTFTKINEVNDDGEVINSEEILNSINSEESKITKSEIEKIIYDNEEERKVKETKKEDITVIQKKETKDINSLFSNVTTMKNSTLSNEIIPNYTVQLVAVYDKNNILKMTKTLSEKNIPYIIKNRNNSKGTIYVLQAGPFEGYTKAKEYKSELDQLLKIKSLIKKVKD